MSKCPICSGERNILVTERQQISPFQNKSFISREEALSIKKENMYVVICEGCGFVYNTYFDDTIELYDCDYNNSQSESPIFYDYMTSSVEYLQSHFLNKNIDECHKILEIGCGKEASYLQLLKKHLLSNTKYEIIGYDPSFEKDKILPGITVFSKLYDFGSDDVLDVDLLISRHVIEHIKYPLSLLKNVGALRSDRDSIAFIETPDVAWILKNKVIFDFSYEHCSFFSFPAMERAAQEVGCKIVDKATAFNSQYMWTFMSKGESVSSDNDEELETLLDSASNYANCENRIVEFINHWIRTKTIKSKMALWGGAGKGNVFLNMFDKNAEYIDYVIDINEWKEGRFISGTGHKIYVPSEALKDKELGIILVMNSNYYDEVCALVRKSRNDIECVCVETLIQNCIN